jgi:hypothetical protein
MTTKPKLDEGDATIRLMVKCGIPINRENYLKVSFLGSPPKLLDGELQAELDLLFAEDGSLIQ